MGGGKSEKFNRNLIEIGVVQIFALILSVAPFEAISKIFSMALGKDCRLEEKAHFVFKEDIMSTFFKKRRNKSDFNSCCKKINCQIF